MPSRKDLKMKCLECTFDAVHFLSGDLIPIRKCLFSMAVLSFINGMLPLIMFALVLGFDFPKEMWMAGLWGVCFFLILLNNNLAKRRLWRKYHIRGESHDTN